MCRRRRPIILVVRRVRYSVERDRLRKTFLMPDDIPLNVLERNASADGQASAIPLVALVGNPNAGKTTLFNALTGLRAKTANFPGTTIEHRRGRLWRHDRPVDLLDLPGLYGLSTSTSEERVARDAVLGEHPGLPKPQAIILLIDAMHLERNLFLASQVVDLQQPTIVALNMIDLARSSGIKIDANALSLELGCPVVPISARTGEGIDQLRLTLARMLDPAALPVRPPAVCSAACSGCKFQQRYDWAESIGAKVIQSHGRARGRKTEAIDQVLTHPLVGLLAFFGVMAIVFFTIFWIAEYPMTGIEWLFGEVGGGLAAALDSLVERLPETALARNWIADDLKSLLVEGIIGGVGGVLVFIPQIAILFFFLSLLEDTGYLARAAFVMDRLMRRVGLPGKAFVPLLSAHACAVPALMACRTIDNRRDRMVTMLVLPLLSCSARIPVYAMIVALLFPSDPLKASLLFAGAYLLSILATLAMAWVFKKSLMKGETAPLVLELPSYKLPNLKNAFFAMIDRSLVFVRNAGTTILVASVILWALAYYPKSDPSADVQQVHQQAETVRRQAAVAATSDETAKLNRQADDLADQADRLHAQQSLANSLAGRIGHFIEPAIRPLGYDWQVGIGLLSSFAAREVFVSTLAIVYGVGSDAADEDPDRLYDTMRQATRSDGSPVFTAATAVSILVFYVLAMQCVSTLAILRRETGSWKWPLFQFAYMTLLAYGGAFVAVRLMHVLGLS